MLPEIILKIFRWPEMYHLGKILAQASKHTPPNTQRTPTHPWLRPPTTTTTTQHHTTPTTHRHRRPPHQRSMYFNKSSSTYNNKKETPRDERSPFRPFHSFQMYRAALELAINSLFHTNNIIIVGISEIRRKEINQQRNVILIQQ